MRQFSALIIAMLFGVLIAACGPQTPGATVPTPQTDVGTPEIPTPEVGAATPEADAEETPTPVDAATPDDAATTPDDAVTTPDDAMMTTPTTDDAATTPDDAATTPDDAATTPTADADTTATPAAGATGDTLVDALAAQGLTTLAAAIEAAGLSETLQGAGPYTIFAPNDEAFAALPPETLQALLQDPDTLAQILTYHVAEGELLAADVVGTDSVTTLQGGTIDIMVEGTSVMLNNEAQVLETDIQAGNGVIHVIDTVLIPTDVTIPGA